MPTAGSLSISPNNDYYTMFASNGINNDSTSAAAMAPPPQDAHGLETASGPASNDHISTIFVVGFPEDMQEREFQNMFIFSSAFEAATLKIPSRDQDEDAGASGGNARKQIIGFAKFKTRAEALIARDILNGRKVDAEKGSVLKAEMAKKNLHTKRGLSSDQPPNHLPLLPSEPSSQLPPSSFPPLNHGRLPPMMPVSSLGYPAQPLGARFPLSPTHPVAYDTPAMPMLPSDLLPSDLAYDDFYPPELFSPTATPTALTFNDAAYASRARAGSMNDIIATSNSIGSGMMSPPMSSRVGTSFSRYLSKSILDLDNDAFSLPPGHGPSGHGPPGHHPLAPLGHGVNNGNGPFSPPHLPFSPTESYFGPFSPPLSSSRGLNSVAEEVFSLSQPADAAPVPAKSQEEPPPHARLMKLSISTSSSTRSVKSGLPSPGVTSPTPFRSFGSVGFSNGDQNPPCSTLYVGNLPPNASEEELKALFSACVGYKRQSFRNKANGPMCFVEFDDVNCATQAMQALHGTLLSNSVKGGIRLSYSKNPLGVRQNPGTNTVDSAGRNR